METDYWAVHYLNGGKYEFVDDDFDLDAEIAAMADGEWEEVDLDDRTTN
jgi:hypothetical protein